MTKYIKADKRDIIIFRLEMRQLFFHIRILHFIPLFILGVISTAWIYPVASPFIPVLTTVMCGLELQFDNILFRTSNEFEAYLVFPVSWKRIIIMKNLATLALTFLSIIITSMALLYFSPSPVKISEISEMLLYVLTVIFPAIQTGNSQSIRNPRRISGFQVNDFIDAIWMLINIAVLSVPYLIFVKVFEVPLLCYPYFLATVIIWRYISVRKTALFIEKYRSELSLKI